jgi:hypothetical protein
MPGEVPLNTLRQKTLATALASSRKRSPSAFTAHARAKTMLLFARALGGLISAFHILKPDRTERLR